jgi:hypothetical protein
VILGGPDPEYNGCPNYLILEHFFEDVTLPVPNTDATVETNGRRTARKICSRFLAPQFCSSWSSTVQQRSPSKSITCYDETRLATSTLNRPCQSWR